MMRWISLINKLFSDINISQGSVATHLRCGGIFNECCIANFLEIIIVERIFKIGQYLTKLCIEHLGFTFIAHPVLPMNFESLEIRRPSVAEVG